ncbi:MAG: TatD family hydrolase [Elusimicrobiota bacterium]
MSQPVWFDTHAHLSDIKFDLDRHQTVKNAFDAGVSYIVEIADGPDEWKKAQELSRNYINQMWWSAGLHPYYADQASDEVWNQLSHLSLEPQFVAIGEVGLDYVKSSVSKDIQIKAFEKAIQISFQIDKPLIIHCRNAFEDLIPILNSFDINLKKLAQANKRPGVIHCFSGSIEHAKQLTEMGFFLGIDGPITYPNSQSLREIIKNFDIKNLVIETDSPYLPPQSHRGKRNEPALIPAIAEMVALLKKMELSALSEQLLINSFQLFRINRL